MLNIFFLGQCIVFSLLQSRETNKVFWREILIFSDTHCINTTCLDVILFSSTNSAPSNVPINKILNLLTVQIFFNDWGCLQF